MSDVAEKMNRGENPFVKSTVNDIDGTIDPIYELKFGLVFYINYPPGPKRARAVYDLYQERYPGRIRRYVPTVSGAILDDWTPGIRHLFESQLLPALRHGLTWGYGFDDGNELDAYLFMFHGSRPEKEKGSASFFRFEFPWNADQAGVRQLAVDMANLIPFESGFGGYFFKPAATMPESYGKMYAICRRFWGIEAWNLDVTVQYVLKGYQSVNWLTLIGDSLRVRDPDSVQKAKRAAAHHIESSNGIILQAAEKALLGDRNHQVQMPGYVAVAEALLPLQLTAFGSFGGERWDEESSLKWIRRFTGPDKM